MHVTLASDMSNIPQFIDSLFTSSQRDYDAVVAAAKSGVFKFSFADPTSRNLILRAWIAAWRKSQGDSFDQADFDRCPKPDRKLLEFVAGYIKSNALQLIKPKLQFVRMKGSDLAVYRSTDAKWQEESFLVDGKWSYGGFGSEGEVRKDDGSTAVVAQFLDHLYHGSHMVFVSTRSDLDGKGITNFRNLFNSTYSGSEIRSDPGNSHYTSTVNTSGLYYLDINSDRLPDSNPLIVAFLTGDTANLETNSFVQHEGWQAHFPSTSGGKRHSADFEASKAMLWNFSTYGASAHSEKRSTPLFLAPAQFSRKIDSNTHMPLYVGAGSLQSWMNPDLLEI